MTWLTHDEIVFYSRNFKLGVLEFLVDERPDAEGNCDV